MKKTHRLTLHRKTKQADDFNPDDETTTQVAEVYASIETKGGNESDTAGGQTSKPTVTITTRWGVSIADIDPSWWGTRTNPATGAAIRYNFTATRNVDERNRMIEIEAIQTDG